jgi:large subunit ribosomal protein L23
MKPHQIIKRPILSEKSNRLKESGGQKAVEAESLCPQVVFEVHSDANKIQIRSAIESLFPDAQVADVHTLVVRGKVKRVGRWMGKRSNWKKAIVTLQPGNKIELFEGV